MSNMIYISEIVNNVLREYKQSELYIRNSALNLGHNYIVLSTDFNHYKKGIRSINLDSRELFVDVSFFNNYDYNFNESEDIFTFDYSLVVISNDFNLNNVVINYKNTPIYFMIDMSNQILKCLPDSYGDNFFDISLFLNYVSSGINCRLDDYYIHQFIRYDSVLDKDNIISSFDDLFLNCNTNHGMYLSDKNGFINIHLSLDLHTKKNKEFLAKLISHLSSLPKSYYRRKNKDVSFYLEIYDYEYSKEDLDDLNIFNEYFDTFNLMFY